MLVKMLLLFANNVLKSEILVIISFIAVTTLEGEHFLVSRI